MKFWDASAVVPLLVSEPSSASLLELLDRDPAMLVWWGTPIECTSAVARRERENALTVANATACIARLRVLATAWHEVLPVEPVRGVALRLLRVHTLRTADSLQLAAAIVASEHQPTTLEFVSLDQQLNDAASREGFAVHPA